MTDLEVETTPIEGLLVVRLPVHVDNRGWFKENWQREKMVALGLPDFGPVQQNVSFNDEAGVTRGIHAEPWDKLVSIATGRVFGAWVDLRDGPGFGSAYSLEVGPDTAVFVPRGVGNGYQTLDAGTAYSYMVNAHWSAGARDRYTFVNLADETVGIPWPLPVDRALLSAADQEHPALAAVEPFRSLRPLVLGAGGQVGRALRAEFPTASFLDRAAFDLADPEAASRIDWDDHDVVINAAAYTAVDAAESTGGRRAAWAANVEGVRRLVDAVRQHRTTLVHISSDYVFDGLEPLHREDERFAPLGVYGQTKAAGDSQVMSVLQHYIVRTSWVVGDGSNFVDTMAKLASDGVSPSVVDDQHGRPSFAAELARGIGHLVRTRAPFGTYNLTGAGEVTTWAGLAAAVFELLGRNPADVTGVSTEQYAAGRGMAPRPRHSALDLSKIESTGLVPRSWRESLESYLEDDLPETTPTKDAVCAAAAEDGALGSRQKDRKSVV